MSLKSFLLCSAACSLALPSFAEESRALDAHEHGHGSLNIAIEGAQVALELEVPGFDIVGFEYEAASDEDKAAVAAALDLLGEPMKIFALPEAAGCSVTEVAVDLHGEDGHDDHDDHEHEEHADEHAHDEHEHDEDHAKEDGHDDHGHDEEHAHDEHDDHDHDEDHAKEDAHDDHDHDEHAHDDHGEEAVHSEFHAEYLLTCSDVDALTSIDLTYFSLFENAEELEVQVVTEAGATLIEATPDAPALDLSPAL